MTTGRHDAPEASVVFWRRTDVDGLERLELSVGPDGIEAFGTVLCTEGGGLRLEHRWTLGADWTVRSVAIERWNERGRASARLDRVGTGWAVDGVHRPDLEGADDPDLSATPFCNTFPIRKVPGAPGERLVVDIAFIDAATLSVKRSRQRYERMGPGRVHYTDLGLFEGFEADIAVDDAGLVTSYGGLFERVGTGPWTAAASKD